MVHRGVGMGLKHFLIPEAAMPEKPVVERTFSETKLSQNTERAFRKLMHICKSSICQPCLYSTTYRDVYKNQKVNI